MGRPKRILLATAEETATPPASLDESHMIARVKKAEGKNLYSVEISPGGKTLLVELPSRFRSQIWIKRGGYVVVDTSAFDDRANKLDGEIINVVREEKQWRKQSYWSVFCSRTGADPADGWEGLQYSLRRQDSRTIAKTRNQPLERCHRVKIPMLASGRSFFKPTSSNCRSLDTAVFNLLSLRWRLFFGQLIACTPPDTEDLYSQASYNNHRT